MTYAIMDHGPKRRKKRLLEKSITQEAEELRQKEIQYYKDNPDTPSPCLLKIPKDTKIEW